MRYEIWSETQNRRIFSSWSLSETLQVWEKRSCQHPGEKMVLINDNEIHPSRVCATGSEVDLGEIEHLLIMKELETLERDGINGFEVVRFYKSQVDDELS
jgi:hypothetical protein